MHVEPAIADFEHVTIRRTGGILGVNQVLHVDSDLEARVNDLAAGGRVYRISSVDLGADEALHGVMFAANRLIERDPDPFHTMTLHTVAHDQHATSVN